MVLALYLCGLLGATVFGPDSHTQDMFATVLDRSSRVNVSSASLTTMLPVGFNSDIFGKDRTYVNKFCDVILLIV